MTFPKPASMVIHPGRADDGQSPRLGSFLNSSTREMFWKWTHLDMGPEVARVSATAIAHRTKTRRRAGP
jgi:hypothetical protein